MAAMVPVLPTVPTIWAGRAGAHGTSVAQGVAGEPGGRNTAPGTQRDVVILGGVMGTTTPCGDLLLWKEQRQVSGARE